MGWKGAYVVVVVGLINGHWRDRRFGTRFRSMGVYCLDWPTYPHSSCSCSMCVYIKHRTHQARMRLSASKCTALATLRLHHCSPQPSNWVNCVEHMAYVNGDACLASVHDWARCHSTSDRDGLIAVLIPLAVQVVLQTIKDKAINSRQRQNGRASPGHIVHASIHPFVRSVVRRCKPLKCFR